MKMEKINKKAKKETKIMGMMIDESEISLEDIEGKSYLEIYNMIQEIRDAKGRLHLCGIGGKS